MFAPLIQPTKALNIMKTYTVTNQQLFDQKVISVDVTIDTFTDAEMESFSGHVTVDTEPGRREFDGQFGLRDFEDEYGFTINNE